MKDVYGRLEEDFDLRGLSALSRKAYLSAVRQLERHCDRPLDKLGDDDVRRYFLHLIDVRRVSPSTVSQQLYAIKFLFEITLKRRLNCLKTIRPKKTRKLPVVLSVPEVRAILKRIRVARIRTCMTVICSCGLRLLEGTHLRAAQIDSDRTFLRVESGHAGYASMKETDATRQGRQGQVRAASVAYPSPAARVLAKRPPASPRGTPRLQGGAFAARRILSRRRGRRRGGTDVHPEGDEARRRPVRDQEEGIRPHAPTLVRDAPPGTRCAAAGHSTGARPRLGADDAHLHAPDGAFHLPGARYHRRAHGRPLTACRSSPTSSAATATAISRGTRVPSFPATAARAGSSTSRSSCRGGISRHDRALAGGHVPPLPAPIPTRGSGGRASMVYARVGRPDRPTCARIPCPSRRSDAPPTPYRPCAHIPRES